MGLAPRNSAAKAMRGPASAQAMSVATRPVRSHVPCIHLRDGQAPSHGKDAVATDTTTRKQQAIRSRGPPQAHVTFRYSCRSWHTRADPPLGIRNGWMLKTGRTAQEWPICAWLAKGCRPGHRQVTRAAEMSR